MNLTAAILAGSLLLGAVSARAAVVTRTVDFDDHGVTLEGYLAYDDALSGPRPGVLIVHQWMGLGDNERMRADMLARLGFVAFATDVYGKGVRPANTEEAAAEAGKYYKDPVLLRQRVTAGLEELKRQPGVDITRLAAIGYCFGGGAALELARSGADIRGVVSFHGTLGTSMPAAKGDIKAKLLVCHGALDPHVTQEAVQGFLKEMNAADVDYQLIEYSGAVHAFTQKSAGDDPSRGVAYNAEADRRSWRAMQDFFAEIFE